MYRLFCKAWKEAKNCMPHNQSVAAHIPAPVACRRTKKEKRKTELKEEETEITRDGSVLSSLNLLGRARKRKTAERGD